MPHELETWAPRLAFQLQQVPTDVRAELQEQRGAMQRDARRRARRKTGRLVRSIRADVRVRAGAVEANLHSDHPGARIQDEGGKVQARRRRMPVPIGSVRVSPRSVAGLFLLKARNGKLFLATRNGSGPGALRLWFRLMSEVTIRGNGFARKAHEAAARRVPNGLRSRLHRRLA